MGKKMMMVGFIVIFLAGVCATAIGGNNSVDEFPEPEKVYNASFPAKVAFVSDGSLYLLDGSREENELIKVAAEGQVELVGWSSDGEWVMYLERPVGADYSNPAAYIWLVKADGSSRQQVDTCPVEVRPVWALQADIIAYTTCHAGENLVRDDNLKIACLKDGKIKISEILLDKSREITSIAWAPNGKSLAVAKRIIGEDRTLIEQVSLDGKCSPLLTADNTGLPPTALADFIAWETNNLKWSPNGQYLMYNFQPTSASLAADGTALQILDLTKNEQALDLGCGLACGTWQVWSPDSRYLAFIRGEGRVASTDKELCLVDMQEGGRVINCGKTGMADTHPVWIAETELTEELLFCRGEEYDDWLGDVAGRLLVPGQRIWKYSKNGAAQPITAGTANTADNNPCVSPAGDNLVFMRLEHYDRGSLYFKSDEGKEIELIKGIKGDPGFYGNYYPDWVDVCWEAA